MIEAIELDTIFRSLIKTKDDGDIVSFDIHVKETSTADCRAPSCCQANQPNNLAMHNTISHHEGQNIVFDDHQAIDANSSTTSTTTDRTPPIHIWDLGYVHPNRAVCDTFSAIGKLHLLFARLGPLMSIPLRHNNCFTLLSLSFSASTPSAGSENVVAT